MKLGLCTGTYSDLSLDEVCRLAVEYGYEMLEIETFEKNNLHFDIHTIFDRDNGKKYKKKIKDYGLEIASLGNHPESQLVMGPYGKDTDDIYHGTKEEKIRFGTEAVIRAAQAANELESPGGRYYFRLSYRGRSVAVTLRPGYVREEFIQLARKKGRTEAEERVLAGMKRDMAARLMAAKAEDIYRAERL